MWICHILFLHSPVDRDLDGIADTHTLYIMSNARMNNYVCFVGNAPSRFSRGIPGRIIVWNGNSALNDLRSASLFS